MKILSVVGARPQFVKLAPLSEVLRRDHTEVIVHTGQHFDKEMSDLFFKELNIPAPQFNLGIMGGYHGEQTGQMLISLESIVCKEKPDLIIVFGDTNTTLAGALVGAKLQVPVVHIEAGLRSFNRHMPEEVNRIVADHTSDYLFAPTQTAMKNLKNENIAEKSYLTGDIMVDSLRRVYNMAHTSTVLAELGLEKNNYYLLTLHRPYNVDNPENLLKIINALNGVSKQIIFPVHPRTKNTLEKYSLNTSITQIDPVGYLDFIHLQQNACKIITDSGGIQKEAYILRKPCITLRPETEWVETVDSGWNLLLNPLTENSVSQRIESFNPSDHYENVFGKEVAVKMGEIINEL